jgi:hypothetical protein
MNPPDLPELFTSVDQVAEMLLAQARWVDPPVNAWDLAKRLNITVAIDTSQVVRARQKRIAGRAAVFLRPEPRFERTQWAIAHEIAEHAAYRVFQLAGVAADEVSPRLREQAANQLASRLLMPSATFAADVGRLGYDLLELKRRYTTASYESIAMRLLSLPAALIVTVFDHGGLTSRRTNLPGRLLPLGERERACWATVHDVGRPRRFDFGSISIAGFAVHEENWKREVLLTKLDPEFADLAEVSL